MGKRTGLNVGKYGPAELKFRRRQQEKHPVDDMRWFDDVKDFAHIAMAFLTPSIFRHQKR